MRTEVARPIFLKDYTPAPYTIDKVSLDFELEPTETRVISKLHVLPNSDFKGARGALVLDGEDITLISIKVSGKALDPADYDVTPANLIIHEPPKKPFTLEIVTLVNPEANTQLSGLYRSRGIFCTQCEAEGFRRITYFLDRPDVLATYTVRLEAPREMAPVLLSNGNLTERGNVKGTDRHFAVWHDPHPKPCYLFALVGGDLAKVRGAFRTASKRKVELGIYVEHGKEDRCAWAMDSLKRSMRWDEKRFGREYDLDVFNIVAVSDFNMGAMENKGLNIFNDKLILASPETATDAAYGAIEAVIAHEYFHNWTGNRITCRDWFQLCLKEGLTVFRDQEFSSDERSRPVQRIKDVRDLKANQFPEDAGPLAHPVRPDQYMEINNFYTMTVYEKGAELCRMIHTMLGEDGFRKGMDLYFDRHDGEAATVEDFLRSFEDATGADLGQFALWYAQSGTPELICSLSYSSARRTAKLSVEQVLRPTPNQARKKPQVIPLKLGLLGADGRDLALECDELAGSDLVLMTKRKQTFTFENVPERPVLSLLRNFSAPVNLTVDVSDDELAFLMAHDSDHFNRWQAGQRFATRIMLSSIAAAQGKGKAIPARRFVQALLSVLTDENLDHAYRALCLTLPSESDLAREIHKDVDPDAIKRARNKLRRSIGRQIGDALSDIYDGLDMSGKPYSPDAKSMGARALRNSCLYYLAARSGPDAIKRVAKHFRTAENMTDQTYALMLLAHEKGPERDRAFNAFYRKWKKDHLVIDQWFVYQAISSRKDTLAQVEKLTEHPLFSMSNPNKVRALIGAFANNNMAGFNRADGAGYAFVADKIIELDGINPQIAARLSGAFRSWRSLEPKRRKLAEKAIRRISRKKGLSRDVYEIVSKTLENV